MMLQEIITLPILLWMMSCIPGTMYFDDLTANFPVPNGYHCLNWVNVAILSKDPLSNTGYDHGAISSPNVAYNGAGLLGTISRATPFEPISVYATAAWNNGLNATFIGLLSNIQIGVVTVTLDTITPKFVELTPLGVIDTLTFIGAGGINCNCGSGMGTHIVLDNLSIL